MAGDPENKIRDGLYVDDDRTSLFEKNEDGSTTIHRKYGGEWHSFEVGKERVDDNSKAQE
jgi:hypothetical protein